jgi:hypothetical protein
MKKLLVLALLFCAASAAAQVDETDFFGAVRRSRKPKDEPQAVAQAVEMAFSSATWTAVKISTMGAVVDLSRLVREGFYKREVITLVVTAARANRPLSELADQRRKKKTLAQIAHGYHLDYDGIYETALSIEKIVDEQYLKRFPQRAPGRTRDDTY